MSLTTASIFKFQFAANFGVFNCTVCVQINVQSAQYVYLKPIHKSSSDMPVLLSCVLLDIGVPILITEREKPERFWNWQILNALLRIFDCNA